MEEPEQPIEILKQGAEAWNRWRAKKSFYDKISLFKANLIGISLRGADLKEVTLSYADLSNADIENTNLEDTDLSRANLSGANFKNSSLKGANLSDTNLNGANFSGANFSGANLSGASLSNVNLSGANLTKVKVSENRTSSYGGDSYEVKASFSNVDLSGANLSEAFLTNVSFSQVDLSKANLRRTFLNESNLSGVNLEGADLSNAIAFSTDLSFACLKNATLSNTCLAGANLSGADLSGAKISKANFSDFYRSKGSDGKEAFRYWVANLSFACLKNAILSGVNLGGVNLQGADLSEARLSDTYLGVVSYSENEQLKYLRSDLSSTCLKNAILSSINLKGAYLTGADFSEAKLTDVNLGYAEFKVEGQQNKLFNTQLSDVCFENAILNQVSLSRASLKNAKITNVKLCGVNLEKANLSNAVLTGTNLSNANLKEADLTHADLSNANLRGADLRDAQLIAVRALGTDFTKARFTGACLEDWSINGRTNLDSIICDYIYLEREYLPQEDKFLASGRYPIDSGKNFEPGEFKALFQKVLQTAELTFPEGIDWQAFFLTFQQLCETYKNGNLSVQAIEKKNDTSFLIRLEVSPEVSSSVVESRANELYVSQLKAVEIERRIQAKSAVTKMSFEEMNRIADIIQRSSEFSEGSQKGGSRLIEQAGLKDAFANFSFNGQPRSDSRSMVYYLQERRKLGPLIRLLLSYGDTPPRDTEYLADVLEKYSFEDE